MRECEWKGAGDGAPLLMDRDGGLQDWAAGQEELRGTVIFRTSGSSGVEKWVAIAREALEWSADRVIGHLGLGGDDVFGLALPVCHVGGFGVVVRAERSGGRLVELEGKWSVEGFVRLCEEEGVTVSSLVPAQVKDLVAAGVRGPEGLRVVVVGGGSFEDELAAEARELGWPVVASYGMTETGSQIATGEGLPLIEGWEVRVREGLLEVRGGGLLSGVITRVGEGFEFVDPKVEGWFRTSDRVEVDGGKLRVLGRADRRVKVLGELVDLEALEEFWSEVTGGEVALVTEPDERRGLRLHLFFEGGGEGIGGKNEGLPGPERLEGWTNLKRLPVSSLGKIDRAEMIKIHREMHCLRDEVRFT
ncbi:MAG: AMP-binding protein [Verrucomicrobiaceae bacterium]